MTLSRRLGKIYSLVPILFTIHAAADSGTPILLRVDGGVVTFDAATNVSAVTVHGKSTALDARVRVRHEPGRLVIEDVNARLPVDAISTGMGLRDGHMRKYIFTDSGGQTPELRFRAEQLTCPLEAGKEIVCKVTGALSIRGVEKPLTMDLKIRSESARGYRASGDGTVKLSDYGIERPSQFGVKVEDAVKVHIEFQGKQLMESSARIGEGR